MGEYYNRFMKEWENVDSTQKGFFGLRDFYNYVKHVCRKVKQEGNYIKFDSELNKAININFDGKERSL